MLNLISGYLPHPQRPVGPQDKAEGLKWTRKAAEAGLAAAQYMFAMHGTADDTEREQWLRKAADQNLAQAQYELFAVFTKQVGQGKKFSREDTLQASMWLHSSALQGNPEALKVTRAIAELSREDMLHKAQSGAQGLPGDQKVTNAAAEGGQAMAQFIVGYAYENFQKDYASAMTWYRKAADQGNAQAELGVGFLYGRGLGVPRDSTQAVAWFRKAAEHGDPVAQNNLGNMLVTGNGVEKNIEEAVTWFQKSANQAFRDGQANLAGVYAGGLGGPPDMVSAYMWGSLAAASGYDSRKFMKVLASKMTPEQIAEAEQKAAAWRTAHPQQKGLTLPSSPGH
jgi:TPR repeat protein